MSDQVESTQNQRYVEWLTSVHAIVRDSADKPEQFIGRKNISATLIDGRWQISDVGSETYTSRWHKDQAVFAIERSWKVLGMTFLRKRIGTLELSQSDMLSGPAIWEGVHDVYVAIKDNDGTVVASGSKKCPKDQDTTATVVRNMVTCSMLNAINNGKLHLLHLRLGA